jgi:hypothetical protein
MSEYSAIVGDFYNDQPIELPAVTYNRGVINTRDTVSVRRSVRQQTVTEDEVMANIADIEWEVIESGSSRFEVGLLNHRTKRHDAMLHLSTYSSSLSGNPGNAYELAYQAAVNPTIPQVYVATPGNGGSSDWKPREREYARQTGRLTREDEDRTRALPTIQDLVGALITKEIVVTRLGTDSAGSVMGVAIGSELAEGQITDTVFNSHPQLTEISPLSLALRQLILEGVINASKTRKDTPDQWPVSKERMLMVKAARPDIYTIAIPTMTTSERIRTLWTSAVILAHGFDSTNDPLTHDLGAFIRQQPEAKINFMVGEHDPLYSRKLDSNVRLLIHYFEGTFGRVVTVPGMTHAFNTYYPQLYQAIKARLLNLPDDDYTTPAYFTIPDY